MAPYSIISRVNEQYRTFNDEVRLRSFDNLIIIIISLLKYQMNEKHIFLKKIKDMIIEQ